MAIKKIGNLEIQSQALHPNHFFWYLQRVTLFILIIFLISVLLGSTGHGLLGKSIMSSSDNRLWVEYERFGRMQAQNDLFIHLQAQPTGDKGNIKLAISQDFLNKIELKQIVPSPVQTSVDGQNVVYEFTPQTTIINFMFQSLNVGSLQATMSLDNTATVSFKQFIYP